MLYASQLMKFRNSSKLFKRFANTLVIVEHNNDKITPISLNAITAASSLGDVNCLVAGSSCSSVATEVSKIAGVKKVLVHQDDLFKNFLPEVLTPTVLAAQKNLVASHIVVGSSAFGRSLLPRVSALLGVSQISDVISIAGAKKYKHSSYAGNIFVNVESLDPVDCLSIRATAFPPATLGSESAPIEQLSSVDISQEKAYKSSQFLSEEIIKSERPELTTAKIVIGGGRGLKNVENFKLIYELADKLGAAIGATRAAVDAGFISNEFQIGQTGKIVAPDLYIAVGISGAIQHVAGIKDSKVIVAINKDPEAPIFQISDYGLVGDLFKTIPELQKLISKA